MDRPVSTEPSPPPNQETPNPDPSSGAIGCPRCGTRLIDPKGLGWCPSCGYCQSVNVRDLAVDPLMAKARRQPSFLGAAEFMDLLKKVPRWVWILLGGVVLSVAISIVADQFLPPDSLPRALWSTLALAIGLLLILVGEVWALILLAPQDEHLSGKDILLATKLWAATLRKLPQTRRQVWLGSWGTSGALAGVFIVNGLPYWTQFYQPKKSVKQNLVAAAAAAMGKDDGKKSLEEAIAAMAKTQDLTNKANEDKPDQRPTVQCAIIGYTVEGNQLTGLVLASVDDTGALRYVGQVKKGFTPESSKEILSRLAPLVQAAPVVRSLRIVSAIWVRPEIFCEVHQSGFNQDGLLTAPKYKQLLLSN